MNAQEMLATYRYMLQSRYIDDVEVEMTGSGEAFFHVSGAGHEAVAALNSYLIADDWLHCHYRDKSLMLARGIPVEMFFLATLNKDTSHSRGRQMNAHMSSRKLNMMSLVGPVGNNALQAAGVAEMIKGRAGSPIVLCGIGDGTSQQGEVLEAIGHATRAVLPVLFVIEDNALAISTVTTAKTFFSTPRGERQDFQGVPIFHVDGCDTIAVAELFERVVGDMRKRREPVIVRFKVERLSHHTNADDQRVYRKKAQLQQIRETRDPLVLLRAWLAGEGVAEEELAELERRTREEVAEAADRARDAAEPRPTFEAKRALPDELTDGVGDGVTSAAGAAGAGVDTSADTDTGADSAGGAKRYTMLEAIRETLKSHLQSDDDVRLFGEDIEDPKGDVFGITKGLSTRFPDRVCNSPLAEASIVGLSVGHALVGARPVAFLQFADFLPIAYNQIFAEMGSMYWRTNGDWQVPMIVMVTCGAYRPGLGPFHASSMEAIAAHTPGIDVFMPSTAADAAGLLNAAFASKRPTLFFYPKSCLNDRARSAGADIVRQITPIGRGCKTRSGDALTFVGWGNTVGLCERAADALAEQGVRSDVIDLRSISPWDCEMVLESVRTTRRLIVVHEDNHTAGMGAEVAATVAERLPISIEVRRVTRSDTFVPCNFANQLEVLPSFRRVLEVAVQLCGGQIEWKQRAKVPAGMKVIEAIGSSPSDDAVTVIKWLVGVGDTIRTGQLIAELEADKAAVELRASQDGVVDSLPVVEGDVVKVGETLGMIRVDTAVRVRKKQITKEDPGTPIITGIDRARLGAAGAEGGAAGVGGGVAGATSGIAGATEEVAGAEGGVAGATGGIAVAAGAASLTEGRAGGGLASGTQRGGAPNTSTQIGIVDIACKTGSRTVSNDEIAKNIPQWDSDDIIRRTGIESRNWISEGESALTLAVDATQELVRKTGISLDEIGLILCSTETPIYHTPSTATLIQSRLFGGGEDDFRCPAYDINAACTGYIYTLQIAHDFLRSQPDSAVLLVTAEALSTRLNLSDPGTAPIFADASTATLLVSEQHRLKFRARAFRPVIGADGEDGSTLNVPIPEHKYITMDGQRVFRRAVRDMIVSLQKACAQAVINLSDLTKVVAHQANQRILNAVSTRLKLRDKVMFSNIRHLGNTSSSTIPLCLNTLIHELRSNQYVGLTAFGGGFTFGGAVLKACS